MLLLQVRSMTIVSVPSPRHRAMKFNGRDFGVSIDGIGDLVTVAVGLMERVGLSFTDAGVCWVSISCPVSGSSHSVSLVAITVPGDERDYLR